MPSQAILRGTTGAACADCMLRAGKKETKYFKANILAGSGLLPDGDSGVN